MSDVQPVSVHEYHQRTKHRFEGFAKGPGSIDWDAQPDPFRRFDGAQIVMLPLAADELETPFAQLFQADAIAPAQLELKSIAQLLEISVAVSAWKEYGTSRWSLRCNPSSGNLHPTETYLVVAGVAELADGIYHYRADLHALELRNELQLSPPSTPLVLVALTSVHWREAWKYGERAYRYCQLDTGHALAAIDYACATLGWRSVLASAWSDEQIAQLLGIDREADFGNAEREVAELCLAIVPGGSTPALEIQTLLQAQSAQWSGIANVLDRRHFYQWPVIDAVSAAATKPALSESALQAAAAQTTASFPSLLPGECQEPAARLFRWRRSAQAFDGKTAMRQQDFYRLLDHTLPRTHCTPWQALSSAPRLHLLLFVHRVEGLAPGLYAFPRSTVAQPRMQAHMNPQFQWAALPDTPMGLPLYLLVQANAQKAAAKLSCQQAIAGDSAFSLAMVAEFDAVVGDSPWRYRELYWEAGAIGQVLYLEAEACGLRGTGIGCFFDDGVHDILGITDTTLQSLYHFTVGGPVQDNRLITLPPYPRNRA